MHLPVRRPVLSWMFGLALVAGFAPRAAWASQVVLTDVTYEHSASTTTDSHYRVSPSMETPANLVSPVDYAGGTAHVRLEVLTKPSTAGTRFQICYEGTPNYACTDQAPTYTTTGTYTWATPVSTFYLYDWTQGVKKLALILKDTSNVKPAPQNVGDATAGLYMPTRLRVTLTMVSPGGTYVDPTTLELMDAGIHSDAGSGTPGDAGVADPEDAGPGAGAVSADAGIGAGGEQQGEPVTDIAAEGGCAAAAGPLLTLAALGAFVALGGRARRRGARRGLDG